MKKTTLLFMAAAIVLSASCAKQDLNQTSSSIPLASLFAFDANSKTILNSDWTVDWNEGDNLTVFNAEAGSTAYSDNCRFLIDGTPSDGKFVKDPKQSSTSLVSGKSAYDWYVCYPWMEFGAKPDATKGYTVATTPQQIGYNSTSHLAGFDLMAGKAYNVAEGTTPSVALHHVCALLKFTVTNNTGEDTPITGLTLDATQGGTYITGSFTMNWGANGENPCLDPTQMGSSKAYTSSLTIKKNTGTEEEPVYVPMDENVANGASVDIYMVVAPFTVASGKTIKLTISGGLGDIVLEKKMTKDITFAAGTYSTANLSYSKPEYIVFTETFGANTVAKEKVPEYNKSGLTTRIPEHAENYVYSVTGNASFAMSNTTNGRINNPDWISYLDGAAVKIVATSATTGNSAVYIKGITVEKNTTYIFKYNKTRGKINNTEFTTHTLFKYRDASTEPWNTVNETTDAGEIVQEFTTGDYTTLDLGVEATDRIGTGTVNYYPAVDLFRLIKK